ncbi:hypothetical protein N9L37_04795 [Flavobacteriaceae bacterium]|jgi:uncharacterized coiled-coil DUF342 family protein|nr:hypothetical protein [Flavobacteriaceae bacterium]MDB2413428.1 hypothetical protein [Flavobacteriaceae bacterium]
MNETIKKEDVVNNSNQPHKNQKNIDGILKGIKTMEIYSSDVENIYDIKYLKGVLERLETNEEELNVTVMSVKERIGEIKDNDEREEEVKENLKRIEKLEEFIRNMCDTDEDKEEPLSKIEELLEENDELNEQITEFYDNL